MTEIVWLYRSHKLLHNNCSYICTYNVKTFQKTNVNTTNHINDDRAVPNNENTFIISFTGVSWCCGNYCGSAIRYYIVVFLWDYYVTEGC